VGWKNTIKKGADYDIVVSHTAEVLNSYPGRSPTFYHHTDGELVITINGNRCCCEGMDSLKISSESRLPGNPKEMVSKELDKKIQQIIQNHSSQITKKIQQCAT